MAQRLTRAAKKASSKHIQPESGPEKAFGLALREIRQEKKLSQEALALESGFDRTYISLLERGVRSPTIRAVVKLAGVLGVRPSEMVARMEAQLATGKKQQRRPASVAPEPRA